MTSRTARSMYARSVVAMSADGRRSERVAETPGTEKEPRRSRGVLVPDLLACGDMEAALTVMDGIDCGYFPPFTLVCVDRHQLAVLRWDGETWEHETRNVSERAFLCFSSGLGDAAVTPPREALFHQMVAGNLAAAADQQDAYHRHSWPEAPQLSVCMRRPDACTVSYTVIELGAAGVSLHYHAAPPDTEGPAETVRLARLGGA